MLQDLVGPWLEERGQKWVLDDDVSFRDSAWLQRIDVDLSTLWDGEDDCFFVNVLYDGVATDVGADFSLVRNGAGWSLRREIMHVA